MATDPTADGCQTCAHSLEDGTLRLCRRYPKRLKTFHTPGGPEVWSAYPGVEDDDYCGEYKKE